MFYYARSASWESAQNDRQMTSKSRESTMKANYWLCFRIALAVLNVIRRSVCAAPHEVEHTYYVRLKYPRSLICFKEDHLKHISNALQWLQQPLIKQKCRVMYMPNKKKGEVHLVCASHYTALSKTERRQIWKHADFYLNSYLWHGCRCFSRLNWRAPDTTVRAKRPTRYRSANWPRPIHSIGS